MISVLSRLIVYVSDLSSISLHTEKMPPALQAAGKHSHEGTQNERTLLAVGTDSSRCPAAFSTFRKSTD